MRSKRRAGITALTAAIALSLGVVPVAFTAGVLPGGETNTLTPAATESNPDYDSIGNLTLATGPTSSVTRYTAGPTPTVVGTPQTLTGDAKTCALVTNGSLLAFTGNPTPYPASLANGSIGVAEKKTGTSCSQVGVPGEKLVLTLPATVRGSVGPALIESAQLDIEAKQSARILATAKNRAGSPVAYFELQSGTTIGADPLVTGVTPFRCSAAADSGPDSGPSDNCRWTISGTGLLFTSLELEVLNGSFSLEGGADGAPTQPSVFQLVQRPDGTLACNAATATRPASGTAPSVQVRRLGNAVPTAGGGSGSTTDGCLNVPYTLNNEPGLARFLKPLDQQPTAQFVADFVWTLPYSATSTGLPATTLDFETPGTVTGSLNGQRTLGWCPSPIFSDVPITFDFGTASTLDDVTVPRLVGITNPLEVTTLSPDMDEFPGKQFACVGSQSVKVVNTSPTGLRVVEQVYVLGDAAWRK